jgi:hypothetical protein
MKVYLAARFDRKDEMKEFSLRLKEIGIGVTSRWLDEKPLPHGQAAQARFLRNTAQMDADDVKAADILIRFSDNLSTKTIPSKWGTGSRLEECGMATAWGKRIVIVGGRQSLFDRFPQRIHVRDAEELLKYLRTSQKNHERDERRCGRVIQPRAKYLDKIRKSSEHLAKVAKKAQQRYRHGNEEKAQAYRNLVNSRHADHKAEVLSHYGPKGKLGCCWSHCNVKDIDTLTLDHVNNDGAAHRKKVRGLTSYRLYGWIKNKGFPEGFQTLCWNHQWKKEIARTRAEEK